jgi:hypothetical protein
LRPFGSSDRTLRHVVIPRALSQVGAHWDFNPLTHNCQHFASEIVCGQEISAEGDLIASIWRSAMEEVKLASELGTPRARPDLLTDAFARARP